MSKSANGDEVGQEVEAEAGAVTGATRIGTNVGTTDAVDMKVDTVAIRTRGLTNHDEKGIAVETEEESVIANTRSDEIMTGTEAAIGTEIKNEADASSLVLYYHLHGVRYTVCIRLKF